MDDYISREAARNGIYNCPTKIDADGYIWVRTSDVAHMIDDIPAADVRPVVHGKWIVDSIATNIFYCSVCGNDAPVEPCGGTEYKSPFCPNCGADMREEGSNG